MKLTEELWKDSQKHELGFWKKELTQDNLDQRQRNAYYLSKMEEKCSLIKDFVETTDLTTLKVMDLGSGPQGILHVLDAGYKIAVDPLMDEFQREGYNIHQNDVHNICAKAEEIAGFFTEIDVVFCLNSIDHHQDPQRVVDEVATILKKGGHFILLTDTRSQEQCDAYHKLPLTQELILSWLDKDFDVVRQEEFPHGEGNPIMQFIVHAKKAS